VWREWCSWGYFNLSFTAITADGKEHTVVKDKRGWDKNYPDFEEFLPGETVVRDVYFGADEWKSFSHGASHALKLQAFYKISEDEDTAKHGVWSGSLESPVLDVIVYGLG
jgi:hypothetical protein